MKLLSKVQISSLFDFTKSKYVRFIDVQHELVDHLASDIEVEMNADSALTFEKALDKVYSKFPISGFSKFVSQSESAMNKYWLKLILSQFTVFAGVPFLILLSILAFVQYQLIVLFGTPVFYALMILAIVTGYGSIWGLRSIIKSKNGNLDDKYLVVSIFKGFAMAFSFGPLLFSNLLSDFRWIHSITEDMTLQITLFSLMFSLSFLWNAMAYYRFPQLIRSELNEKYAHLNLSV